MAAPIVTKPAKQTSVHGTAITPFQVEATESPTEYKATGLPTGLTIKPLTGKIEGTPTKKEVATVKLSALNESGESGEVPFEWAVGESTAEKEAKEKEEREAKEKAEKEAKAAKEKLIESEAQQASWSANAWW